MKIKYQNLWPLLIILALTMIYFWSLLFGGQTYLFGPLLTQHYPGKVFYSQSLNMGQLPLWSPNIGLGYPLLAGGEIGALYLPNLILYYFLPVTWAYNLSFSLHFFLGAVFMYMLARTLELSPASCLAAAITLAFSGFMSAQIINPNLISAVIYLPLIFALINLYFKKPKTLHLVGIAAAWALQFYAGDIAISFLTALAAALYVYFPSMWKSLEEKNFNFLRQDLIWGICTALLAFILALGQLLPTYELSNFTYLQPPKTELLPLSTLWREQIIYLDIIPLALVFLSLGGHKSKVKIFFGVLLGFSGLLFIWASTPFYSRMSPIPGFKLLAPSHFMALAAFAVAILAGFGLERLLQEQLKLKYFWFLALMFLLVLFLIMRNPYPPFLPKLYKFFPLAVFLFFLFLVLLYQWRYLQRSAFIFFTLFLITLDLFLFGFLYTPLSPIKAAQNLPIKFSVPQEPEARHRFFFPDKIEVVPDVEDLLKRILGPEFLPEKVSYIEEEPPAAYKANKPETEPSSIESKGEILNLKYEEQKVAIKAAMKEKGWLVLKDNYYPGWEAYVDGQKVKTYRGNYTMRAVFLEKGDHQVEFMYRPKIFKWGVIMTILGILVSIKLAWWSIRTQ